MQETERKRGENGDLHLVANTGFVVLFCALLHVERAGR